MKSIDTLVEDIYAQFGADPFDDERVKAFGQTLARTIAGRTSERKGNPSLRVSNFGTKCDRKLWYSINSPDKGEPLRPETRFKFLFGDILEAVLIFLAKEAGHDVQMEQAEVELYGVIGHIDCIIDGVVVDCKSASTHSYRKFAAGLKPEDDAFGYLEQLRAYCACLTNPCGAFLVVDKTLGKICLDKHTFPEVDYKSRVSAKREMLVGDLPDRGFSDEPASYGNRKLGVNCSYCDFKHTCWPGLTTVNYKNGYEYKPVFLTQVKQMPKLKERG